MSNEVITTNVQSFLNTPCIPEQSFPLPHRRRICDIASTPPTAQVVWMIQNYEARTAAPAAVVLYRHAAGSQPFGPLQQH
jgi:hypothetical protein